MKSYPRIKNEAGFTLIQALFILVVLALLGVAMMRLTAVQSSTSLFALQGARAYQAARSGLEWGAAQAAAGISCNGHMEIGRFAVAVVCTQQSFTEGSGTYDVYSIRASATFGNYGSPDYILRRVEMKVGFP